MESKTSIDQIASDLCLDPRLLKIRGNGAIIAAVPTEWVNQMLKTGYIEKLSATEDQIASVYCVTYEDLPESWQRLQIKAFQKSAKDGCCCVSALKPGGLVVPNLDLLDWMQTLSTKEFAHQWKTAFYRYETLSSMYVKSQPTEVRQFSLTDAVKKIYSAPIIRSNSQQKDAIDPQIKLRHGHPNIYPIMCAVDSQNVLYLLMPDPQPSLHDSILFSPAMLENSYAKLLFVIYQLFQAVHHCHASGIPCGDISLRDFELTEDLWLKFLGPNWNSIIKFDAESDTTIPRGSKCNELQNDADSITDKFTGGIPDHSITTCTKRDQASLLEKLPKLVQDWVLGHISNFEYLMVLNSLAGREMGNPNYHPIFPWVIDFSCPNGGFRDLSKSKFRLNKGDEQLDLTYEASIPTLGGIPSQPRHHISDILSEITYYIYQARRTPKAVLCKHVRSKWVPNEYPVSIQRLQAWTPDECIPEFFADPNIFLSIHEDLPDLGLPTWASSPEEFISHHRRILEGDFVSERLHKWIDLTFGCKLSGNAAVKARNVCLQLVDHHTEPRKHGVLQLFAHPHPKRLTMSRFTSPEAPLCTSRFYWSEFTQKSFKAEAPKIESTSSIDGTQDSGLAASQAVGEAARHDVAPGIASSKEYDHGNEVVDVATISQEPFKVVKDALSAALTSTDDVTTKNPIKKLFRPRPESVELKYANPRPEMMTIVIPEDYKPLAMLDHIESLYTFTGKSLHELPSKQQEVSVLKEDESDKLLAQDMVMVGCLIAEIVLAPKLQMQRQGVSFTQRCTLLRKLCIRDILDVPRPVQSILWQLLQLENTDFDAQDIRLVAIKEGYPPPSMGLLLQTHGTFIPFPAYFPAMYELICKIKQLAMFLEDSTPENTETSKQQHVFEEIQNIAKFLPKLLDGLTAEGKEFLLPYLIPLFQNEDSVLYAFLLLFNTIAQHLGPEVTEMTFCALLKKLYKSPFKSSNHILTFHKAFLSQLISRLGFDCFLQNFVEFLVEILIGQHTCPAFRSTTEFPLPVLNTERHRLFTHRVSESQDALSLENDEEYATDDYSQGQQTQNDENTISHEMDDTSDGYTSEEPNSLDDDKIQEDHPANQIRDTNEPSPRHKPFHNISDDKTEPVKVEEAMTIESSVKGLDDNDGNPSPLAPGTTLIETAMESILWLADRIGPCLTAVDLSRRLLCILEQCFCDQEQLRWLDEDSDSESSGDEDGLFMDKRFVVGDTFAEPVFHCLIHITEMYGEEFIFKQYLPYIQTSVASVRKKINTKGEASLVSCLSLLKFLLPYLNDTQLMEKLKFILQKILKPLILTLSSLVLNFPGGGHVRSVICFKIVDLIISIALRIGREMAREHMISLLQQFFLCFSLIHGEGTVELAMRQRAYDRNTSLTLSTDSEDMYCEIKMDSYTRSYKIGTPTKLENLKGEEELSFSPNLSTMSEQINNCPMPIETLELFDEKEGTDEIQLQLQESFTPELAYAAYIPLCRLIGDIYMSNSIENSDLIWKLSDAHEKALSEERAAANALLSPALSEGSEDEGSRRKTSWFVDIGASVQPSRLEEDEFSGSFGTNVTMTGNRIDISDAATVSSVSKEQLLIRNGCLDNIQLSSSPTLNKWMKKTGFLSSIKIGKDRHITGTWYKHWQQYIENEDQNFNFCQLKLQCFVGHSGGIRSLHVLDNEQTFFSASKDKTVKVWSLTSRGNGTYKTPCRWTYYLHKRAAFSVTFLESVRLAASCDGTVHVWDPFKGAQIRQYDMPRCTASVLVKCPAPSCTLLAGTTDASVRIIDTRTKDMKQEFRVTSGPLGLIRCLAVNKDGNLLGVGLSSGVLSMVDLRTGLLLGGWKAHEGEILQIKAHTDRSFVTSSVDHSMALWRDDGHRLCSFRGVGEPVHCFSVTHNEIISATTSNRIGIYNSITSQANCYISKIRHDVLKGNLSALEVLPKQRLFLMASDNSSISLSA